MPASPQETGDTGASRAEQSHSGKLLLRMPQSLHAELARAADAEGVSLNAFITGALAAAVAWRRGDQPPLAQPPAASAQAPPPNGARAAALLAPPEPRAHARSRVLMANFVVVAVAAVAAIALLIVALVTAL